MSRFVVRPPFLLHPEELPVASAVNEVDPLGKTANGRSMARACSLLVEALAPDSTCPDDLKARARAARSADELEVVVEELARWAESRSA
jgi:hypothetical protein